MATTLSGQVDLGSANEGVALAGTTDVASFTDSNGGDTASAFTATINWGDGSTTVGTVVGSNGAFTVEGGHTYADEGFPQATVNVTHTADNTQLALSGTIAVADTDNLTGTGSSTITFTPNQPLTNVTVATFTDTNATNVAGDFTASIDWGDGTTTTGTVSGSNGSFSVQGSHTYAAAGANTITVFMNDDFPDSAFAVATTTAVSGFGGQVVLNSNSVTEGTALTSVTVATFSDTKANLPASDYTATINWGDGTTTTGTVSGSNGSFTVTDTHTYADEFANDTSETPFQLTATIVRTTDHTTIAPSGSITAADSDDLTVTGGAVGSSGQSLSNVTVASFTDAYTGNVASDFIATINWGDGSTSAGTISGGGGSFDVAGSHTYAHTGQNTTTITVREDFATGGGASGTGTANVGLAGQEVLSSATENVTLNGATVATFTDGNSSDTAGDFTATINWGDGTTSVGTVSGGNGSFSVTGTHTYADEGSASLVATIVSTGNTTITPAGTVTIAEGDALTVTGLTINGSPNVLFSGTAATFTDTDTGNVAGDFTATINWGDGTTTVGTISGGGGAFSVSGSHTYASAGQDTLTIQVADDAPGTATGSGTGTANIGFAGRVVLQSATENVALNGATVATFGDNSGDTASQFTAAINWGDGTTTVGTVSGGSGSFTVTGSHTYADEASAPLTATVTRTTDNAQITPSGNVTVGEADALTGQGVAPISATAHQALNNVMVATFSDTDTANFASDFTATINWGDGQTTTGTVAGSNGSFSVTGSHTYSGGTHDTITVTMADDAPGTATAMATTSVTITGGTVVPYDFNGDGKSDLLFQNTNATPQIWLMNGTSVISETSLVQPPPQWKIVGSGDFNGDGLADILWINTVSNQPAIWEMNGTSIISAVGLVAPPSSWRIAGIGDFDGNGTSDILWQNSNGQPSIWEMNGTSIVSMTGLPTPPPQWRIVATGDFNGDGKSDILWFNTISDQPAIWEMNGTSIISAVGLTPQPANMEIIGTGDFAGNGDADILWLNTSTNAPTIWMMNGTSVVSMTTLPAPPPVWRLVGTSDVNGDGKSDLLWQNTSDGTVTVWEMNGTSIAANAPVGSPGVSWILNNNDPPLPSSTPSGTGGTMHMSMPDGANGNTVLGPATTRNGGGTLADGAGGQAWGSLGGFGSWPGNLLWQDPMPGVGGLGGGAPSPSPLLGGTTIAGTMQLGIRSG
jgi:FG-GAP-like repeat